MSALDSAAVFRARALGIGLTAADVDAMAARGWSSYSTFGHASSAIPGQTDDTAFTRDILVPIVGAADHVRAPMLRKLYYEAYTINVTDLRVRAGRTGDEPARSMPGPERMHRFRQLKALVSGVDFGGVNMPSNYLIDVFSHMVDEGTLRHVAWDELSSRPDELRGAPKKSKEWKADASGVLKETITADSFITDVSSDLKMVQALHRRGTAMHIANLLDYRTHDMIVKMFLAELQRTPPHGYRAVSVDQLCRADVEIFRQMADHTQDGLLPTGGGDMPLTALVSDVMKDPTVRMMLMPLPEGRAAAAPANPLKRPGDHTQAQNPPGSGKRARARAKAAARRLAESPAPAVPGVPKGKGKGKVKGRAKGGGVLPAGLAGAAFTEDGSPICFAYNLDGCTRADCTRKHVCTQCQKAHPFRQCLL